MKKFGATEQPRVSRQPGGPKEWTQSGETTKVGNQLTKEETMFKTKRYFLGIFGASLRLRQQVSSRYEFLQALK